MRNFTTHTPTKQGVLEAFPSAAPSSNARWQKNQPRPALALTAGTSFGPFGKRVRMLDTNVLVAAEETDLVYVRQVMQLELRPSLATTHLLTHTHPSCPCCQPVSVFKQLVEAQRMWDDPDIMPESDVPLGSSVPASTPATQLDHPTSFVVSCCAGLTLNRHVPWLHGPRCSLTCSRCRSQQHSTYSMCMGDQTLHWRTSAALEQVAAQWSQVQVPAAGTAAATVPTRGRGKMAPRLGQTLNQHRHMSHWCKPRQPPGVAPAATTTAAPCLQPSRQTMVT